MLGYIFRLGQVVDCKHWIESSMAHFFELPAKVWVFTFIVSILHSYSIFGIYGVILSVVVHPNPLEYFLHNIIGYFAGDVSFLLVFLGAFFLELLSISLSLYVAFICKVIYWKFP